MSSWDPVYRDRLMTIWEPHDIVVQFVARFLKKRQGYDKYAVHRDARRILDLGCGNGAQSVYLARLGYEVHGIDVSEEAIRVARDYASRERLEVAFSTQDCDQLSCESDSFDAVICHGVLDHIPMETAIRSCQEAHRVLRPGGLLFVTLASVRSSLFGEGLSIGQNTYVLEHGPEEGHIQHYFDEKEIRMLLLEAQFRLIDARHNLEEDLTAAVGFAPKTWHGRWILTAEALSDG
jgi:ubiquinone biosynthesis O-methyltransferase